MCVRVHYAHTYTRREDSRIGLYKIIRVYVGSKERVCVYAFRYFDGDDCFARVVNIEKEGFRNVSLMRRSDAAHFLSTVWDWDIYFL